MIITVVCDVLGEENNGTTVAAMNLIRYLKGKGHDVRVLCADENRLGEAGFYVVPNLNLGKALNAYVKKVGVTLARPDDEIIRRAIVGADRIHTVLPFLLGMRAVKLAHELGIPITASFHMQAENFTSYVGLNKVAFVNRLVYKFIYKNVYSGVDAVHYPTEFIRDTFEGVIKKETPAHVISNGVHSYVMPRECRKPRELRDRIVILTTGRYSREKSQDTLIKAVRLSRYRDRIQLILGGQGVKERYYRRLAKGLPIPPIFKFYSRTEIIDVLNYADIYVHPAEMELEGISCLEAIACGKLTVVSDSRLSATRNFAIDSSCIFKNRNPKDLARVIDYWIENPELRREYEARYLESSRTLSQDACMAQMEKMIIEAKGQ